MSDSNKIIQYVVKCKGSSQPYVESYRINEHNPDYVDLLLGGGLGLSDNPEDYTVYLGSAKQRVVEVDGKTLIIEII